MREEQANQHSRKSDNKRIATWVLAFILIAVIIATIRALTSDQQNPPRPDETQIMVDPTEPGDAPPQPDSPR